MAPEMALSYVVGWIPSLIVTGVHFKMHQSKRNSQPFQRLQENLLKVNKYWLETEGRIVDWTPDIALADEIKFKKSLLLIGTFFFFMSWIGFFFNLLVLISIHWIAISRYEQATFESLSKRDLSETEIHEIMNDLPAV